MRDRAEINRDLGYAVRGVDAVVGVRALQDRVGGTQRGDVVVVTRNLDVDLYVGPHRQHVVRVGRDPVPHLTAVADKRVGGGFEPAP